MESLYRKHSKPADFVPQELFTEIVATLNYALPYDFCTDYPELATMIEKNNAVFSAFKVHDECSRMAKLLVGDDGQLRSFDDWVKKAEPIAKHHNKVWMRTEYDTAVKRAQQARDWKQFEAEADVLPNLRWVPSTAAKPGPDHSIFWDTIRPIDDPFWSAHHPGDRWGCQCSLEATDEPATAVPESNKQNDQPAPGLEGNPAKTGELFSKSHPYFPDSCASCPFSPDKTPATPTNKAQDCANCKYMQKCLPAPENKRRAENEAIFNRLSRDKNYINIVFDEKSGGVGAIHISHAKFNPREQPVLNGKTGKELEWDCQNAIVRNGGSCILEAEPPKKSSLDSMINGERMDIASITKSSDNIVFNTITRKEGQTLKFNKQTKSKAHSIAIYYDDPSMYSENAVRAALTKYRNNSRYVGVFDTIVCVVNDDNIGIVEIK